MNESNDSSSSSTPDSRRTYISEYAFHQQHSANCIIFPMLNRKKADELIENNYQFPTFKTRKDWVGINAPYEIAWRSMLQELNTSPCHPDYQALQTFLDTLCLHGPSIPTLYTDAQKTLPLSMYEKKIQSVSEKAIILKTDVQAHEFRQEALEYAAIPYFFADITTCRQWEKDQTSLIKKALAKTILKETQYIFKAPCGITPEHELEFFNNTKECYKRIPLQITDFGMVLFHNGKHLIVRKHAENSDVFDASSLIPLLTSFGMQIPHNATLTFVTRNEKLDFGSWRYAGIFEINSDGFYSSNGHLYAPYALGYYKLMLLRLGIDEDNNIIASNGRRLISTTNNKNIDVMIALQKLANQHPLNPWNDLFFSKETFLQYALAEILKEDPTLARTVENTIDFFWRTCFGYDAFMEGYFYNALGTRMNPEEAKFYMPCKVQLLAYAIMQNVHYLWYGAQNLRAFCDTILEIGTIQGPRKAQDVNSIWHAFKSASFAKKNGVSFMDSWYFIRGKLLSHPKFKKIKNWTSFDDHGWVASFDQTLINMQNALPAHDNNMLKALGLAVIDSWQSEKCNVFYKRSMHGAQENQNRVATNATRF